MCVQVRERLSSNVFVYVRENERKSKIERNREGRKRRTDQVRVWACIRPEEWKKTKNELRLLLDLVSKLAGGMNKMSTQSELIFAVKLELKMILISYPEYEPNNFSSLIHYLPNLMHYPAIYAERYD